jgi:hypothetical protein
MGAVNEKLGQRTERAVLYRNDINRKQTLSRPGGNATGFASYEFSIGGKCMIAKISPPS